MTWIKRNLLFLIGSVVALAMLGAAGFYLFTKNSQNNELSAKLDEAYGSLNELNQQNPHPGNDKVDNIKAARAQQQQTKDFIARAGTFFTPVTPIPAGTNVTDEAFAAHLRKTIEQLRHDAATASVTLPPNYDFSFSAIKSKITFAAGSLQPLAAQLGEVKALCDVLFHAKINALDSLRRGRVSTDDKEMADYTELSSVTNDLAVLTPYEVTFHCFSAELAGVLAGFASSSHGFVVHTINVDSTGAAPTDSTSAAAPVYNAPAASLIGPPAGAGNRMPGMMMPGMFPAAMAAQPAAPAVAAPVRSGLQTVLNERPLKVSMVVELVKLKNAPK